MKAFPTFADNFAHQGMDLRDYFAAKAMLGFITSSSQPRNYDGHEMAKISYQMADAMMEARNESL
jgi:hypothetical protein